MNYEKLGAFYLGRRYDPVARAPGPDLVLYDAKDLTTHAVCVGMTGSGKTGLCVALLEEAAIDGIPVLAIDPKGDLGNLLLTFPELRADQFAPWIDPGEALRKGVTPDEHAAKTAQQWRAGLASWDQTGERIARLRDAADFAIYTPGSSAGLSLTILKSFGAPPAALLDDGDAFRERVQAATSGLLTLLGIDADPLRSREHIFIANLFDRAWREGRDLALVDLIHAIQTPPFERLGVFELESFYPAADRFELAMRLNNLLASPGFAAWTEGEPLDVGRLLWTETGKPRVTVLSIAHLNDAERMFFVTMLLNEVVAWMRTQSGTTSLRAILYMDEVFGYLPPTANPPSKLPMLTLLKQARAFGLGCVLATQNPVDLDYKALSNAGTWFLGRLQTERDKARVLDGLESVSSAQGVGFDRRTLEATLSSLDSRVFLMNNVHDDAPTLFHSRWAMSYLRGPLTRAHIQSLMAERKAGAIATAGKASALRRAMPESTATSPSVAAALDTNSRPVLPPGIEDRFVRLDHPVPRDEVVTYRPALHGQARLHFVSASLGVDEWQDVAVYAAIDDTTASDPWRDAQPFVDRADELDRDGEGGAHFASLPKQALDPRSYARWGKDLADHLYRTRELTVYRCKSPKAVSRAGASEGEFRQQLVHAAREARDLELEKLRKRYSPKIQALEDRIARARERVERERQQYSQQKVESALSIGATLLGAIFGRKKTVAAHVRTATTAARTAGRAARERGDVGRAEESLESLEPRLRELEAEFDDEATKLQSQFDVDALAVEAQTVSLRKSDTEITAVRLVWTPWHVDSTGRGRALFD